MFICLLVMVSKALSRFCFRLRASLTCGGLSGDKIYEYLLVSSCLNSIRSIVYCCCRIDNFLLNGNRFACHSRLWSRPFTWFLFPCNEVGTLILHNAPSSRQSWAGIAFHSHFFSREITAGLAWDSCRVCSAGQMIRFDCYCSKFLSFLVVLLSGIDIQIHPFTRGLTGRVEIWTISSFHFVLINCMITINIWRFVYFCPPIQFARVGGPGAAGCCAVINGHDSDKFIQNFSLWREVSGHTYLL